MARHYVKNPAGPAEPASDKLLTEARAKAEAAAARLRDAEQADPALPGWEIEYTAATAAVRAASRRVEALEQLRAGQLERAGKRNAALKAAAPELKQISAALAAARDAVGVAADAHLKSLAGLGVAVEQYNAALAQGRARLAGLGLRVRDELADGGADHAEGTLDGPGLRAEGVDWIPIPAGGIEAHALRQVFASHGTMHPLAETGKYRWRSFEVEARGDGLRVPTLADVGAVAPEGPQRVTVSRPPVADVIPTIEDITGGGDASGNQAAPRRGRAAR